MYDIYAYDMEFEQCLPTKERISLLIPYTVIHYVLSGEGYINGKKISAGTAFIASKNSYMDYCPDFKNPWSYIFVRLHGDGVKKAHSDCDFSEGVDIINFNKTDDLLKLLSLHHSLNATGNTDAQKIIANALILLHKSESEKHHGDSVQESNAAKIKKYIDENFFKKLTLEEIAGKFYLSSGYVRNLFFKFFSISPKQYLQNLRMERASELLCETDMSVSLIAHSVGYDDALLFSKMFSKHFGMSPTKYRRPQK